ncbi:damage-inducible protein DinB [Chitinophaga oryzae]|uniref:Damage-inducible protein DinB n=1 Tax=Chitinophaga oryzae TaxID=2725414 RepID=A0AAE7D6F7_9BACT|nr:DinB family protein [Chitinophaga oryzae]QJB31680.1 damage-inducible protein DinB [Chitinophaga oryzae]QJB38164.1 damage-inducible protein DinB [Chitinophaga oryzae]
MENTTIATPVTAISSADLLEHYQGHRRLTRRLLEGFPEDRFFDYSIGGMRSVAALAMEQINVSGMGVAGAATRNWQTVPKREQPATKQEILDLWDKNTRLINEYWPMITEERFLETDKAFGMYEGVVINLVLYFIDNEIHHRGQIYVYYRSLGLEPAPFYER